MMANLNSLPVSEKIKLVEDLWDSIAQDNKTLPITEEQKAELDLRLEAYAIDREKGKESKAIFSTIRNKL